MSFVASSNCALYCGAKIDLVDINKDNFNICTKALEEKLITAKKKGKLPKVLIVVHFAGLVVRCHQLENFLNIMVLK